MVGQYHPGINFDIERQTRHCIFTDLQVDFCNKKEYIPQDPYQHDYWPSG